MEINEIIDVESKIDYCFNDKRLLIQAFTRSDVANELNIESIFEYADVCCESVFQ